MTININNNENENFIIQNYENQIRFDIYLSIDNLQSEFYIFLFQYNDEIIYNNTIYILNLQSLNLSTCHVNKYRNSISVDENNVILSQLLCDINLPFNSSEFFMIYTELIPNLFVITEFNLNPLSCNVVFIGKTAPRSYTYSFNHNIINNYNFSELISLSVSVGSFDISSTQFNISSQTVTLSQYDYVSSMICNDKYYNKVDCPTDSSGYSCQAITSTSNIITCNFIYNTEIFMIIRSNALGRITVKWFYNGILQNEFFFLVITSQLNNKNTKIEFPNQIYPLTYADYIEQPPVFQLIAYPKDAYGNNITYSYTTFNNIIRGTLSNTNATSTFNIGQVLLSFYTQYAGNHFLNVFIDNILRISQYIYVYSNNYKIENTIFSHNCTHKCCGYTGVRSNVFTSFDIILYDTYRNIYPFPKPDKLIVTFKYNLIPTYTIPKEYIKYTSDKLTVKYDRMNNNFNQNIFF